MNTPNLDRTEEIATSHGPKGARISLEFMKRCIVSIDYFHPAEALPDPNGIPKHDPRWMTTVCCLQLSNGFMVMGSTCPADPANFNHQVGRDLAYEDALRKCWPLFGFALRSHLHQAAKFPDRKAVPFEDTF